MTKADREILGKLTDVILSLQTEMTSLKGSIDELRKDVDSLKLSSISNNVSELREYTRTINRNIEMSYTKLSDIDKMVTSIRFK